MSHEMFPTIGGTVTRAEVYRKLMHHLREASHLCAVMSHLHNTETSPMDLVKAKSWLAMSVNMERVEDQFRNLATGDF